jgi:hypothetical protein
MKLNYCVFLPIITISLLIGACAGPPSTGVRREGTSGRVTAARVRGTLEARGLAVSLAGAKVAAGDRSAVAGPDGTFRFAELPRGKNNLVVEKTFDSGPIRRIMGVATIYYQDNPVEITVPVRDATDLDGFCLDCHPYYGKKSRRDQIIRCLHVSGLKAQRAVRPGAPLDPEGKVTCESCHAVHRETGIPHYVLASYMDGKLCNQCH